MIDLEAPQREVIAQAMRLWSDRTPIRFVPRTTEANYVRFQLGPTCAAHVGMQGGEQGVFLAADCPLSNTIHEIGHTIGLWHEQSRQDRDRHIVHRPEAIPPAAWSSTCSTLRTPLTSVPTTMDRSCTSTTVLKRA